MWRIHVIFYKYKAKQYALSAYLLEVSGDHVTHVSMLGTDYVLLHVIGLIMYTPSTRYNVLSLMYYQENHIEALYNSPA